MVKCIEELYDEMQERIVLKIGENDEINSLWKELNKFRGVIKKFCRKGRI